MFFGVGKPMMLSELQSFKILTPFETSLTPQMAPNGLKIIKNTIKLDKMLGFSLNLVLICFLGWKKQ